MSDRSGESAPEDRPDGDNRTDAGDRGDGDGRPDPDGRADAAPDPAPEDVAVRQARPEDEPDVVAFAEGTWADHEFDDYVPDVFGEWVETDGPRQRTIVADRDGRAVGVVQVVLVSEHEAWGQGIRVHPDHRGEGVADAMTFAGFDWAREQGATVVRNMVFSWNVMGLGHSRAVGYRPAAQFRWVHPDPGEDVRARRGAEASLSVLRDPELAWSFWTDSRARDALGGLGLTTEESWAVAEVSRGDLHRLGEDAVLAVRGADGVRGMAYRTRTFDREDDAGVERTYAEYGVGAWADLAAGRALLSAVARDADRVGADRCRVLVPETGRVVSDAAYLRVEVAEEPDFVLAADLTADYRGGAPLDRA